MNYLLLLLWSPGHIYTMFLQYSNINKNAGKNENEFSIAFDIIDHWFLNF